MENKIRKNYTGKDFLIQYKTVLILAALIIVFTIMKPVFINPQNLMNMLKSASFVAVTAFGMTFIIVLGGLDLSVGANAAVVGVTMSMLFKAGVPIPLTLIIVIGLAMLMGWANGIISVKGNIEPFLVTLATMNIYRGIAMTLSAGRPIPITGAAKAVTNVFGNGTIGVVATPVIIIIIAFIVTLYLYKKSKFGFYVRCIGGNAEAARVAGIPVGKIKIAAYTLNGLYACIAGLILASLFNSGNPELGGDLALDAIAAVILGGTAIAGGYGTIWGTLGGILIMGALNNGMYLLGAQTPQQILVKGIVIILAVLMSNIINKSKK